MRLCSFFILCFIQATALGLFRRSPSDFLTNSSGTAPSASFCPSREDNRLREKIDAFDTYVYCAFREINRKSEQDGPEKIVSTACPGTTSEKLEALHPSANEDLVDDYKTSDNASNTTNFPISHNSELFNREYRSYQEVFQTMDASIAWGAGLLGFWALLIIIAGFDHWVSRLLPHVFLRLKAQIGRHRSFRWLSKHLILPALFHDKHATRAFLGSYLPTRLESVVLSVFFALVIIGYATDIYFNPFDTIWKTKTYQLCLYVGIRSGVIAVFLMIPTYLFAGRNNFLLWITGWRQSTFYTYHKWLARITILSALIHTITMVAWENSGVYNLPGAAAGVVAMIIGACLVVLSFCYLRAHYYEAFLYAHIGLAIGFLAATWSHIASYGYGQWAYAAAAIWCFDILMRILRISTFGLKSADARIISDEMLILTIIPGFTVTKPKPGSFGYIYFCNSWLFFQSHPFSVVSDDNGTIKFLIKIKDGMTRSIYKRLTKGPDGSCKLKIALEGFYGEYRPVFSYDEVILLAGDNGITGLYAYADDIAKRKESGKSKTKLVKLYWVIRHWKSLEWFLKELKQLQQYEFVQIVVYVTRYNERRADVNINTTEGEPQEGNIFNDPHDGIELSNMRSDSNEKEVPVPVSSDCVSSERFFRELPYVQFRDFRPSVLELIQNDIQEADPSDNISVLTCGHPTMCDDARQAVAFEAGEPRAGRLDLFETLQVW